jgi:ABC-type Fe3+ transport system permease subunit
MSASGPSDHSVRRRAHEGRRQQEARSLDLVQRVIVSALVAIVFGTFSAVLAAYLAVRGDQDLPRFSVVGLWIMTGVLGLVTAAGILLINRRKPYSPWVLLGLLPMVISAPWILR